MASRTFGPQSSRSGRADALGAPVEGDSGSNSDRGAAGNRSSRGSRCSSTGHGHEQRSSTCSSITMAGGSATVSFGPCRFPARRLDQVGHSAELKAGLSSSTCAHVARVLYSASSSTALAIVCLMNSDRLRLWAGTTASSNAAMRSSGCTRICFIWMNRSSNRGHRRVQRTNSQPCKALPPIGPGVIYLNW